MSNKSNELANEIVQLKATKSQTLESINNVLVEIIEKIKKINNSYAHFKTEINGKSCLPGSKSICDAKYSRIPDFI